MKKVVVLGAVGMLALGATSFASEGSYFTARVSGTLDNEYHVNKTVEWSDVDTGNNAGVALEFMMPVNKHLDFGFGIGLEGLPGTSEEFTRYTNSGKIDAKTSVDASMSIPLYMTGKVTINPESDFKTYIKADLGFAFNSNTKSTEEIYMNNSMKYKGRNDVQLSNGLYAGIGAGVELKDITLDIMYKINLMDARVNGQNRRNAEYTRAAVTLGYKF